MKSRKANQFESSDTGDSISHFETQLLSYCETQAKHDGSQNKPTSEGELRLLAMNHIETEVQVAIEKNKIRYLPISGVVVAQKYDTDAKSKTKEISADVYESEHKIAQLENTKKQNCPDKKAKLKRSIIFGIVVFNSAIEGTFVYEALRASSFPKIAALISGVSLALGCGILTHVSANYIKRSTSIKQMLYRYLLILIPAVVGCYFIGHLRAKAYTSLIQLDALVNNSTLSHSTLISGWGVTIICFLTFLMGLVISVKYAKTEKEELQEKEYDKACAESDKHLEEVQKKKKEINEIQKDNQSKTEQALANFEHAHAVEKRLKLIAQKAINVYTITNIRYRKDSIIPAILSNPPAFQFTTFFENINNK